MRAVAATLLTTIFCAGCLMAGEPSKAERERAIAALEAAKSDLAPERLYELFSDFCRVSFRPEDEPLMYQHLGKELRLLDGGDWVHASRTSATIAFESNLPAAGHVEWGESEAYGRRTEAMDRPYFLHIHALTGLKPDTTYHYRTVVADARGTVVRSPGRTLRTAAAGGAVEVPGTLAGPPYRLDASQTTYVLTSDITAPGVAFEVVGDDITLDLNGYTVTFGAGAADSVPAGIQVQGGMKNRLRYLSSGFRILNGRIRQGNGPALAKNAKSEAFCPLVIKGDGAEVAGVHIDYHGPQTWGMTLDHPSGAVHLHHNVFTDGGAKIVNRHGSGTRSIGIRNGDEGENAYRFHRNLVRRTRQNGFGGATSMYGNEIYVDSWSTNSFAMQPLSKPGVKAGELHGNRIFGTGFNVYGFGWAHESLKVHGNLIYFQGIMVNKRWDSKEDWGDLSCLEAMRVTNYGKGGQVRNDLEYWNNLIVLKGRGGCELRGTGFFSDTTIKDLVFRDNIVKVVSEDAKTTQVSCISVQGHHQKADSLPVVYRGNTLISNLCHIRLGDSYGKGNNHVFAANQLLREGERSDYHTVVAGGAFWTLGTRMVDNVLGKGVSLTDVLWQQTASKTYYAVQWSLSVEGQPGTRVRILDASGSAEFDGSVPEGGVLAVPLTQFTVHPPTWPDGGEAKGLVGGKLEAKTPHQVLIGDGGAKRTITMDRPQQLRL